MYSVTKERCWEREDRRRMFGERLRLFDSSTVWDSVFVCLYVCVFVCLCVCVVCLCG